MEYNERLTKNIAMAQFIGAVQSGEEYSIPLFGSEWYAGYRLMFHTTWDWLMPVVEKIERLGYNVSISYEHMPRMHSTSICDDKYKNFAKGIWFHAHGDTAISNAFSVCYQFIDWYNNLQTKAP